MSENWEIAECIACPNCHSLYSYEWAVCPDCGHLPTESEEEFITVHQVEPGCITVWEVEELPNDVSCVLLRSCRMMCPVCWGQVNEEDNYCEFCGMGWTKCSCGGFLGLSLDGEFLGCISCCMIFDQSSEDWEGAVGKFQYATCSCGRGIIIESEHPDSWMCKCGILWQIQNWELRVEFLNELKGYFVGTDYEENPNTRPS